MSNTVSKSQSCNDRKRLQSYFLEISNRLFYLLFSLFIVLYLSYQKSITLLYFFVFPFTLNQQNSIKQFKRMFFRSRSPVKYGEGKGQHENCHFFTDNVSLSPSITDDVVEKYCWTKVSLSELITSDLINVLNNLNKIDVNAIKFIFTDIEEAFSSRLFVCFVFSFLLVTPFLFYNLVCLIRPCLYKSESVQVLWFFILFFVSLVFIVINIQFTILPKLLQFLYKFSITGSAFSVLSDYKIASYLNWSSKIFIIILTVSLFFVSIFLFIKIDLKSNNIQRIKSVSLKQKPSNLIIKDKSVTILCTLKYLTFFRKVCLIVLLIISALFSPPDFIVQLIIYLFLIVLLELSIWFFCVSNRRF